MYRAHGRRYGAVKTTMERKKSLQLVTCLEFKLALEVNLAIFLFLFLNTKFNTVTVIFSATFYFFL